MTVVKNTEKVTVEMSPREYEKIRRLARSRKNRPQNQTRAARSGADDELFAGCRKARIAIRSKGKGKSGGGRVVFFEVMDDRIILLYIYDKSEMESVQTAYITQILERVI